MEKVIIYSGFWLDTIPAAWFHKCNAELISEFGFGIELSTKTVRGTLYYSGAGRTTFEQFIINPTQFISDHKKGRAIDINNQLRFRNINERRFIEILNNNGYQNIQVNGNPFPQEPWHFACWRDYSPNESGNDMFTLFANNDTNQWNVMLPNGTVKIVETVLDFEALVAMDDWNKHRSGRRFNADFISRVQKYLKG